MEKKLLDSIGIKDATWQESPQGITAGGIGLNIKTEDIARFGQFYLQQGVWQGKSLLPEAWINEATTSQISNSDGVQIDWTQGYGYQFWRCRHNAYRGDGVFGQYCVVMPEQDAVLAITGGIDVFDMQQPLNLIWDMLLPEMYDSSLHANIVASTHLANKLDSLSMLPVKGEASSSIAPQISERPYTVDANELTVQTITFSFKDTSCDIVLKTSENQETIICGYGTWQRSQTTLFRQPLLFDQAWVATSGAWTNEDTLTIIFRLYETPFYYTMECYFADEEMLIEISVNVSLESTKPLVMTAKRT